MSTEVLILNTAVVDFRGPEFGFTDALSGPGGLAKSPTAAMPAYAQADYQRWIAAGRATAGGPGNTAPLLARAGIATAVGVNLGAGGLSGLDVQGRYFHDVMTANGIDMSATVIHPVLPTGTTFIHDTGAAERGGIVYFPNANNDFDFAPFRAAVERLNPRIVYYMCSGLSDRGDANGGRDLADFIAWCRARGCVTIADSHTLTGEPHRLIHEGVAVAEYRLLEPLLPQLDIFFTSADEAKMIVNTLGEPRAWDAFNEDQAIRHALNFICRRGWRESGRARLFGVTFSGGAYLMHSAPDGTAAGPERIESRFMAGEAIDLVGAGDSFRAGVIAEISKNLDSFRAGTLDCARAAQMGNLFASLYIKAPIQDRYGHIRPYEKMARVVDSGERYASFPELVKALD